MMSDTYHELDLPNDEELERLTRYVGGYMTDEEVELFDRQLETDQEFFYRMAPMLDAWYSPEVLPIEIETLEELDREQAREARKAAPSRRVTKLRWRKPAAALATCLAAAEVLFIALQGGTRAAPELSRMVAHVPPARDSLHGRQAVPAPRATNVSSGASTHIAPHPRQVAVVKAQPIMIPRETIADQALLDSTMRSVGPMPSAQTTRSAAVVPSDFAPTQTAAGDTTAAAPDSTKRNPAETMQDKTDRTKTNAGDSVVKGGFWAKVKGWISRIGRNTALTGGGTH